MFKKSVVGTMVSLAVTASLTAAASAQEVISNNPIIAKQAYSTSGVQKSSGLYIVQLKQPAGVEQAQALGELVPNNQLVAQVGNRYNAQSSRMKAYTKALSAKQNKVAKDLGNVKVLHNYVHSFNGFSAKLNKSQAKALRQHPDVAKVWEDELHQPATANTSAFLGLTGAGGQHTLGIKGEDVIVGVLDTGITPENPSFADDGSYSDPSALGWAGACDTGVDETFACNNKLIGARYYKDSFEAVYDVQYDLGEMASPRDSDGHGSHTAGTAAGNEGVVAEMAGSEIGVMSGIAPRARIAMYKVCWNSDYVSPEGAEERGCFYGDTMAAIDQAVADGVDVINYSIGGSRTDLTVPPTAAMLRAADAGVFVSVSAGNSGPTTETVGTPAPWVMSVGMSTYDGSRAINAIEVTSREPVEIYSFVEGAITKPLAETGDVEESVVVGEPLKGCYEASGTPTPLDNAAEVDGNIVLIERGACAFVEKVERARLSGAAAVLIYSDDRPITALGGEGYSANIPGGMIARDVGESFKAAIEGGENMAVRMSAGLFTEITEVGNIMDEQSSRGPNGSTYDLIKPDITAPGVNVLAATTSTPMFDLAGQQVKYLTGTSMAAPHIAGMAALFKEQYADWTPAQIKSALMTTAYQDVFKEDGVTPADPFDFGAGHANPVPAMDPRLTYNAEYADYLAFLCGVGNSGFVEATSSTTCSELETSGFSLEPSQLNYPSIALGGLLGTKTVSRTVTDMTGTGGTYTVTIEGLEDLDVSFATYNSEGVETDSDMLEVAAGGKASYSITFTRDDETPVGYKFGAVILEAADGTQVRSPIAINVPVTVDIDVPAYLSLDLKRGRAHFPVEMMYSGRTSLDYAGFVPATKTSSLIEDQDYSLIQVPVPEGTKVARFSLSNEDVAVEGADLDLQVYACNPIPDNCVEVGSSGNVDSNEEVLLINPEPLNDAENDIAYYVQVFAYGLAGEASTEYTLSSWVASEPNRNTRVMSSSRAIEGRWNNVRISSRGLDANETYMGGVTFYNDEGEAQGTTVIQLNP
ncbi:S8 family serine peptidase [Alteromonas sp. ASW11-130]|uniref:S8 family serine peptidase n=1 Tax=Alteromonas sp. ASW11-130 TaxID=3015775 RepID=UPI00224229D9|nr:S8 family serine peptidase [Alteromonas sp. ASW11-130]MCW8090587.1 S8 family serine peptidase [Alteromonas sp. ASW11-130]